jgi:hypothetical protein
MYHETLGEITREEESGEGVATVGYGSRRVEVRIVPDDQAFETLLAVAAEVVARLGKLDSAARRTAAEELTDTYNTTWRMYDEVQSNGSMKAVTNPPLSVGEFEAKLSLAAIDVEGSGTVSLSYDDEGMFWGHIVVVSSRRGADFTDPEVGLVG